jgi:hypothetical protein
MFKSIFRRSRTFGIGVASGALLGVGIFLGVVLTAALDVWPAWETPLEAVASSSGDTMAIATGPIDEGVEGIFVLDFITSELTCQVLNPRFGKVGGLYRCNVAADLGIEQGKQPKYLLATGYLEVKQNIGNVKPAHSVVYVADVNTGRYVAYILPWNKMAATNYQPQAAQMQLVGGGSARNIIVEK